MKFYVYTLTDPRTGRVFYVGKGQGERMYQHEKDARGGRVSRKCTLIREILADGYSLRYATVSRHREEGEAYKAEAALIEEIGLANLTNIHTGILRWFGRNVAEKAQYAHDLEYARILAGMAYKTQHFKAGRWWFAGRWFDLKPETLQAYKALLQGIYARRGFKFIRDAFNNPYGVTLRKPADASPA